MILHVDAYEYTTPIVGGRIVSFKSFPRILVLHEMQTPSYRFWTRVAVSIVIVGMDAHEGIDIFVRNG